MSADGNKVFKAVTAMGTALSALSSEEQQRAIEGVVATLGLRRPLGPEQIVAGAGTHAAAHSSTLNNHRGAKRLSVVEFVNEKNPATNAQALATFAAYRQQHEGQEFFSKDDLLPYFAKAKMKSPKGNFSRDYGKAVADGFIHDDGAKSYLTRSGEAAVEAGFGGKAKPRGQAVSKGRSRKRDNG